MMRRRLRILATLLLACPTIPLISVSAEAMAALSKTQQTMLTEQVIPAYQAADTPQLIDAVVRLTTRMNSADLAAVDAQLSEGQLPTLGEMLLDARSMIAAQAGKSQFLEPRPRPLEIVLVLTAFHDRYREVVRDIKGLQVMSEQPTPARKLSDYESVFWTLRQSRQRVAQTGQVAQYVQGMAALKVRVNESGLSESQRTALAADYGQVLENLSMLDRMLQERELELRMQRLADAVATLRDSSVLKDRLIAAHVIDADGLILTTALQDAGKADAKPFLNSRFNDPAIGEAIRSQIEVGRELAGETLEKSRRLFAGVHWWLRGRYGRGANFYGLVKGQQTGNSRTAHDELYMPNEIPRNDGAASDSDYDYPDRRHYYTWLYETRTLQVRSSVAPRENPRVRTQAGNPSTKVKTRLVTTSGKISGIRGCRGLRGSSGSYFAQGGSGGSPYAFQLSSADVAYDRYGWTVADLYKKYGIDYKKPKPPSVDSDYRQPSASRTIYTETYIPDQDPYMVYRLVGLLEYAMALEHFDTLVARRAKPITRWLIPPPRFAVGHGAGARGGGRDAAGLRQHGRCLLAARQTVRPGRVSGVGARRDAIAPLVARERHAVAGRAAGRCGCQPHAGPPAAAADCRRVPEGGRHALAR